jgi:Tat protein translocase TatB subunit
MFGIGMPELILILAIALIVVGPKRLPDIAKSLGRALGEFKKATSELKDTFEKEAGMTEVKKSFNELHLQEPVAGDTLSGKAQPISPPAASTEPLPKDEPRAAEADPKPQETKDAHGK